MAGSSASPQPGGFFLQACLPSPAPSAASARSTAGLPRPRRDALRPGSSKEALVRRFVEEQLLNTACRYVKKFAPPDPADPVVGFANFGQIPFLLKLASDLTQYIRSFPPAPRATFSLLGKLDHCFASLLSGQDVDTLEPLPEFENGLRAGMTVTDMVRCRSLVEQTRFLVVEVMSGEADEEDESEDEDAQDDVSEPDGRGQGHQTSWDMDQERLHMDAARIYEKTIVQLGSKLGDPLTTESVPDEDVFSPTEPTECRGSPETTT